MDHNLPRIMKEGDGKKGSSHFDETLSIRKNTTVRTSLDFRFPRVVTLISLIIQAPYKTISSTEVPLWEAIFLVLNTLLIDRGPNNHPGWNQARNPGSIIIQVKP